MHKKINKSKRKMIGIPEGTEIYEFLESNGHFAHWELLNNLVKQMPKSREDRARSLFDEFVERFGELFPDHKREVEFLRPLIFKKILTKQQLEPWYYEELKQGIKNV